MTGNSDLKIAGLLLAAGGSSRMGRPKQLLQFEGKTLLRRAAESMADSMCDPIVAVFGAESDKMAAQISGLPVHVCLNEEWETGMGSSIKAGLNEMLRAAPDVSAVVIMLCDQPFITARVVNQLAAKFTETRRSIIAAKYNGIVGVPALFSKDMFGALLQIKGDKGARELIRDPNASIETIEIKEAAVDIDTPDDADRLGLL